MNTKDIFFDSDEFANYIISITGSLFNKQNPSEYLYSSSTTIGLLWKVIR